MSIPWAIYYLKWILWAGLCTIAGILTYAGLIRLMNRLWPCKEVET